MAIVGLVFGDAVGRPTSAEEKSAHGGYVNSGEIHRFAGAVEHGAHVAADAPGDEPPGNGGIAYVDLRYIAGQAGWVVAECGRQPWAIRDMLPTSAAISKLDVGSVQATFFIFVILFTVMLIAEIGIMLREIKKGPKVSEDDSSY